MDFQLGEPEESGIQSLVSAALDTSQYNFNSLPYTELDRRHSMVNLERRHSLVDYKDNNVLDLQPKNKSTKYYALRIASIPGIYKSWDYCSTLINGCPGAKYKSFYSLQESIDYIRQQFPEAEFKQEGENWLLVDNSPVFKIIEEARTKKEKIMGLLIKNDCSSLEKTYADYEVLKGLINSKPNLQVTLNKEQLEILSQVKKGLNLLISAGRKTGKNVLLDHIYNYLANEKKTFHVTSASIVTAMDENINYTLGWTGMGKALGTLKNMLAKVRKNTSARKAWADCDVIIIKDCSLLSSFLIEVMDYLGKQIRKSTEQFGGIQIILIGDLFGVKPQNTNSICCPNCGQTHKLSQANFETGTEPNGYMNCCNPQCGSVFRNSWIQYAFESACWTDSKFQYYELRKSYCADSQLRELVTAVSRQDIDTISELTSDCIIADESLMKNVPTLCTTAEEANSINEQKIQELKSFDCIKFDAIDVVLNNFDFTARAEQKEGPTEETLELRIGAKVLVMSSTGRTMEHGVLMSMVKPSELEKQDMFKRCGMGYPQYEKSVNDWLSKNPLIPRVKMTMGGEIRNIGCWLYAIHTCRRVVAWRVQVPIRLAYAVPIYKCHRMKLENLYIKDSDNWKAGDFLAALDMCKQFKSLNIREGFTKFQVDSRVVKFLKAAEVGKPIPGLQPEVLPASGASSAPQLADQFKGLKRTASMSIDNSLSKKRRSSILYINSTLGNDNSLQLNTQMINQLNSRQQMMNDKNTMLAYQQMYGNRRHSYQPLTSFQEQQFAFYQTSPMIHNNQMNLLQSPIHQAHLSPSPYPLLSPISRDIKTDRSMSTPFIYHGQYTPQSNNQMLRSGNQSSPLYPQSPANIYPQSPVTDMYNNSSNSTWPQWQSPK